MGVQTYQLWQEGPWDHPKPIMGKDLSVVEARRKESPQSQLASTINIIEKNLFDPERGASKTKEFEASSLAMQRLRGMVLVGTVILGESRYAILRPPPDTRTASPGSQTGQPAHLRLKLGDTVEGFNLSEIEERRVVFAKGNARVEVSLDFFRKLDSPLVASAPGSTFGRPTARRTGLPPPPIP